MILKYTSGYTIRLGCCLSIDIIMKDARDGSFYWRQCVDKDIKHVVSDCVKGARVIRRHIGSSSLITSVYIGSSPLISSVYIGSSSLITSVYIDGSSLTTSVYIVSSSLLTSVYSGSFTGSQ